ncbi:hypothetical protein NMY22_g2276 [Coprinellus aureogranulatus]|nr:hypothetical protein NMY22_g2276 [Coprinellus aureogranulatus]
MSNRPSKPIATSEPDAGPPEKRWAASMPPNWKSMIPGSPERPTLKPPSRSDDKSKIQPFILPMGKTTPGSVGIGERAEKDFSSMTASLLKVNHPNRPRTSTSDGGDSRYTHFMSQDGLRASVAFLDAHMADLEWMRNCLVEHHNALIRTRNLTQSTIDAIGRALYVQAWKDEVLDHLKRIEERPIRKDAGLAGEQVSAA